MVRPSDLPEFDLPPVTEVVLGVQFNSIPGFLSPHLGLAWNALRSRYPKVEEHPPLLPAFELFGSGPNANVGVQFVAPFGAPRVFFIDDSGARLFQLQHDRFIHNWRKVVEGDIYPRFGPLLDEFVEGYRSLDNTLDQAGLGPLVPNQCEVSYINQLTSSEPDEGPHHAVFGLFDGVGEKFALDGLGMPENASFTTRYVIRGESGDPLGRMIISGEPV